MTLLVFLGLSAFVVDYGVLWVSRAQAQNAADAGAVAGAVARAYDDSANPPASSFGIVADSVQKMVFENPVWFDKNAAQAVVTYECPPAADRCVKVEVHRDGAVGSSPLPRFFLPVLGIPPQGVRATAIAQVAVGNGTKCLKPWAIPDKWVEGSAPQNDSFERYDGAGMLLINPDVYSPPPAGGLTFAADLGRLITLSFPNPDASEPISEGFLLPLVLPGGNSYEENIAGCNGRLISFGKEVETGTPAMAAATSAGAVDLIASDPGASWNPATNNVEGTCAPVCASNSPRLVALAVFNVAEYQLNRATSDWDCDGGGSGRCVNVVNIVGFFLDHVEAGGNVVGHIARYPGLLLPGNPTLSTASSFLPAITLVR